MSWTVREKPCALRRQTSKVGTVCASGASAGLCGGAAGNLCPYRDIQVQPITCLMFPGSMVGT
jgi:hypothetical protein